jgi:integrase
LLVGTDKARAGNLAFIAKQVGHKDFTMLVQVYAKWMDDESSGELR